MAIAIVSTSASVLEARIAALGDAPPSGCHGCHTPMGVLQRIGRVATVCRH